MHARFVVLGLLTACRFHFDERGDGGGGPEDGVDVLAAHDEDGDGVVDSEDVCPHRFDVLQIDDDGDRVGNGCDLEPSNGRQSLVFFDPMLDDNNWTIVTATWVEQGDALLCNGTPVFCEITRPLPFQFGTIYIGLDIRVRNTSVPQYQVAVAVFDARTMPYHYVEVWEDPASPPGYAAVSRFNGSTFAAVMLTPLTTNVHVGRLDLAFQPYQPGPVLVAEATWPGEPHSVNVQDPTYTGGSTLSIGAQGVVFELAYVAVVATN